MQKKLLSAVIWLTDLKKRGDKVHISAYAAKGAFFILLSAVPLITLTIGISGVIFPLESIMMEKWFVSALSGDIKNILVMLLTQIQAIKGVSVISVSSVLVVWSATRGIRSIAKGIGVIYGAEKGGIVAATIRPVVYTFFMLAALGLSFVVLVLASPLEKLITVLLGAKGGVLMLVLNMRNIIFFLLLWLLFSFAYSFLGQSDIPFKAQLLGGALASAGWIVYSFGYSVYIKYFSSLSAFYGGFGTVMLFMVWLYMCMHILLWGAVINRIKWQKRQEL